MPTRKPIHFILTGGTIDSYYDGVKDMPVPNKTSVVPAFIASLKLYDKTLFTEVCMKDSRDLTMTDRQRILNSIKRSPSDKIIILHGTYTMPDTARYLEANLQKCRKTIIITGAMIPLVGFSPSDSPFNLGYAFAMVKQTGHGVHLAMNGRLFTPAEVLKELRRGRFTSIWGNKMIRA